VDLGVTFGDMDGTPGIDLILPDIKWLADRRDRIDGIVITHAHEDHIGALGLVWDKLRAPVYARRFTMTIGKLKLEERGAGIPPSMLREVGAWPETFEVGPFRVGMVPISHSIPESAGLVIDSPQGRIVHSGDFKVDPTPVVGEPFLPEVWEEIGRGGVRALMCDSTNVFSPIRGGRRPRSPTTCPRCCARPRGWWWPPPSPPTWRACRRSPTPRRPRGGRFAFWAAPCGG
jgi:ribonuclease J